MGIDLSSQPEPGTAVDPLDRLAERLRSGTATAGVVGLGYVGLPLLTTMHEAGFRVLGIDRDEEKIARLAGGISPIADVTDAQVADLEEGTFSAEPAPLAEADVIVLCLPTPLTDGSPDLTMVLTAAEDVARYLRPGMLVVLESTTYPGTTEELLRPILESTGLLAGRDFALGYSPERMDPGQSVNTLENTPKIVAGLTERCAELVAAFYGRFVKHVVVAKSPREAEMAKLVENTFRQVNIALVNELAILAHDLDVDIWEALRVAATKPFGYLAFWPGPGVGGHCIAIDPTYLSWRAGQQLGYRIRSIEHANEVNNRMPAYVVSRIGEALNDAGKPIKGSRILALGVAYKAGIEDLRESPSLGVIEGLLRKGAELSYADAYVPSISIGGKELRSVLLDAPTLAEVDCAVILTAHPEVDYEEIVRTVPLVFDARGVTTGMNADNVVRL
ncbi:MAG TPA: nucleotide sugar dehydrogenase [Actinomycetota bacterium]